MHNEVTIAELHSHVHAPFAAIPGFPCGEPFSQLLRQLLPAQQAMEAVIVYRRVHPSTVSLWLAISQSAAGAKAMRLSRPERLFRGLVGDKNISTPSLKPIFINLSITSPSG